MVYYKIKELYEMVEPGTPLNVIVNDICHRIDQPSIYEDVLNSLNENEDKIEDLEYVAWCFIKNMRYEDDKSFKLEKLTQLVSILNGSLLDANSRLRENGLDEIKRDISFRVEE